MECKHNTDTALKANNSALVKGSKKIVVAKPQNTDQTYTDANGFTLSYPKDWLFVPKGTKDVASDGASGEFAGDEFVSKANFDSKNNAQILIMDKDTTAGSATEYSKQKFASSADTAAVVSSKSTTINGYQAELVNHKLPGGIAHGNYIVIVNSGKAVTFSYSSSDSEKANAPIYKSIINSIKFTN